MSNLVNSTNGETTTPSANYIEPDPEQFNIPTNRAGRNTKKGLGETNLPVHIIDRRSKL